LDTLFTDLVTRKQRKIH